MVQPTWRPNASQHTNCCFLCVQENQDKFLLQLNRDDGWSVMGVFDGHGMWGGKVASLVRDSMLKGIKDVDARKMNGRDPEMVSSALHQLFLALLVSVVTLSGSLYGFYLSYVK